ncbi:MAG: RNA polymerase sigma factor (TIGR02999 family) [Francisellaceae bacterium]|jgi:RNA polymerase sigma factor (TIGR02999 family)
MTEPELITLIQGWQNKDHQATQTLMGIAYQKIKELSIKHREKLPDNANTAIISQSSTDLAHDVYIRLVNAESTLPIDTLREFYQYLNAAVRNTFIDSHRKLVETKSRNLDNTRLTSKSALTQAVTPFESSLDIMSLAHHIDELSKDFPRQAESLELRYFAQRSNKEIARMQDVSLRTVENDLRFSKAWLKQKL